VRTLDRVTAGADDPAGDPRGVVGPLAEPVTAEPGRFERALRELQQRHDTMFDHVQAGIVLHGRHTEVLAANAAASELLGLSEHAAVGALATDPRWRFVREDGTTLPTDQFPVSRAMALASPVRNQVIGVRRVNDDELVWVLCNAFPILDGDGTPTQAVVSFTDVTALKRAELALQKAGERLRLVLRGANDAAWDWDRTVDEIYYSPRWWQMIGEEPDERVTDPALWTRRMHPDDRDHVGRALSHALTSSASGYEVEFRLHHRDGHWVPVLSRGFVLRDDSGHAVRVSGTNTDLTERKRAEVQINRLAYYDALTGLPNRRLLLEQLHHTLATSGRTRERGALLFIDLDDFKALNDTRGHQVGDELLRQVAQRLLHAVRGADTVARLGGDEFVVVLEGLGRNASEVVTRAREVCQKLVEVLGRQYRAGAVDYQGTVSVGIALFDEEPQGVEALLQQADLAMYQAKAAGRDTFRFFDAAMQRAADEQLALQHDLRRALRDDQLLLHVQPQVEADGTVVGAEALLRWQHPERGLVLPMTFIPLAEQTGLIVPVGEWVLRSACGLLARWAGVPRLRGLTLSVNVSVRQFQDAAFVASVHSAVEAAGADPHLLRLEITESLLADDVDEVVATMTSLRELGLTFSLDDFGTGYSSLSYLQQMPLREIKIDRSFVRDVLDNPQDATIARIILSLAGTLGLTVVAEGVETAGQAAFLVQHGCQVMQGYLFGRPGTVTALERRLDADT
jgi:diguanylate cyclase (GGDEF)-like protein/PAS domain S-box-containing protein